MPTQDDYFLFSLACLANLELSVRFSRKLCQQITYHSLKIILENQVFSDKK